VKTAKEKLIGSDHLYTILPTFCGLLCIVKFLNNLVSIAAELLFCFCVLLPFMEVLLYAESESDASAVLCCHFSAYFVQFWDIVAAYIFIATILHLAE